MYIYYNYSYITGMLYFVLMVVPSIYIHICIYFPILIFKLSFTSLIKNVYWCIFVFHSLSPLFREYLEFNFEFYPYTHFFLFLHFSVSFVPNVHVLYSFYFQNLLWQIIYLFFIIIILQLKFFLLWVMWAYMCKNIFITHIWIQIWI